MIKTKKKFLAPNLQAELSYQKHVVMNMGATCLFAFVSSELH